MAYEPKDGSVTMFQNKVEPGSKKPKFTITGMYKGEKIKLALWAATTPEGVAKKDRDGNTFFNGTIGPDIFRQGGSTTGAGTGTTGAKPAPVPSEDEMFT